MKKYERTKRENVRSLEGLKESIRAVKQNVNDLKEISDMVGLTKVANFFSRKINSMTEEMSVELTELIDTAEKDKWLPKSLKAIGGFFYYVTRPFRSKKKR